MHRAFAVLDSFDDQHRVQRLAEIARRSKLPRSTALRLARKLTDAGALERLDSGEYVIGLHLLEIASLAPRGHGLRALAMPYLEDLFYVARQHVLLAVRDDDEALLVERLSAPDAGTARFRVGGRMPLTGTGIGLVLLAAAPRDVQERHLAGFQPDDSVEGMRTREDLRRALADIRRAEYAVASQIQPSPITTAAAPILAAKEVVAAISVVAPSADFDMSIYVPAIRATARAISREIERTSLSRHGTARSPGLA